MLEILVDSCVGCAVSFPLAAAYLRRNDRERFRKKRVWAFLLILYLNALFFITGVPDITRFRWNPGVNLIPFACFSGGGAAGAGLNIALFIPFGGFITLYFKKFREFKHALPAGFLLSMLIEALQLFSARATDIDDIIANTLGTAAGFFLAKAFCRNSPEQEEPARDGRKLAVLILLTLVPFLFIKYLLMEYLNTHIF